MKNQRNEEEEKFNHSQMQPKHAAAGAGGFSHRRRRPCCPLLPLGSAAQSCCFWFSWFVLNLSVRTTSTYCPSCKNSFSTLGLWRDPRLSFASNQRCDAIKNVAGGVTIKVARAVILGQNHLFCTNNRHVLALQQDSAGSSIRPVPHLLCRSTPGIR